MKRPNMVFPAAALLAALLIAGCSAGTGRPAPGLGSLLRGGDQVFPEEAARGAPPEDAFRVTEFGPTGVVPWENVEGGVWVLFNRAVVALSRLGQPAGSSEAMSIDPPVEGVYRWYGSRLLSFEPSGSLEPAVEYTVSLAPRLASLDGAELAGMNAFRFRTPALRLAAMEPSGDDVPPEDCRELLLTFSYPVDLAVVRPSLRVQAGGRNFPFDLAYAEAARGDDLLARRAVILSLKRELPWDSDVEVLLREGARAERRHYGTAEAQSLSFHTLRPLTLETAEVHSWLPTVEAQLTFNHPVQEEAAAAHLSVGLLGWSPEGNVEVSGGTVTLLNLPVPFESSFPVLVRAGLRDIYGQALAEDRNLQLEVGPAGSYARFRAEGDRILEAGFPPVVAVEFQNVAGGAWAAGPLADPFQALPSGLFTPFPVGEIPRNTRIFRAIDLSPFLSGGKGAAFARWRFTVPVEWSKEPAEMAADLRLQVTDLGFTSHIAADRVLLRVARLSTGLPVAGAEAVLRGARGELRRGVSDGNGRIALPLGPGELARFFEGFEESMELEVREGADRLVFRPAAASSWNWNFSGPFEAARPQPLTYLTLDRGIYRPGEDLSFYGIDRDLAEGRLAARRGGWRVTLERGWSGETVLAERAGVLTPSGRFWGRIDLPATLEPDDYLLVYTRGDGSHIERVPVRVAFFRRVNFAVQVDLPREEPKYMGDRLEARFHGEYLAGGRVARGQWRYWWARAPVDFRPPDPQGLYRDFRFGRQDARYGEEDDYAVDLSAEEGELGGDGTVAAAQALAEGRPGRAYEYRLNATVEDIDRQAVSRSAAATVLTSSLWIGAKITRKEEEERPLYFIGAEEPFTLAACLVRPDGSPADPRLGTLEGRLLREEWKMARERSIGGRLDTRWEREEIEEQRFTMQAAEEARPPAPGARGRVLAAVELRAARVGYYIVELRGRDGQGREALTRLGLYSTGSGEVLWQRWDEQRIDLVADRPVYSPGERARLLVKSPLAGGSYLLTVEREGILEERVLSLEGNTSTVEVDIREEHLPVVYVTLSAWTGRTAPPPDSPDRPDLGKPRGAFGTAALAVDPGLRRIELEVESDRAGYRPGSEAELAVRATWQGRPLAGAEIVLVAADRGVLDLIDYHLADPLEQFYSPYRYPDRVAHYDTRSLLLDPVVWKVRDMPGGDKEGEEPEAPAAAVRRDFRATAVFEPGLVTGADGTARLRFRLPDQLTTFRVTAVALKADPQGRDLFGLAEGEVRVQNPLNVRPALPRLLRVGDTARAGVVITNLDDRDQTVTIRMESDLLDFPEGRETRLTVPAGRSAEAAFRFKARRAGTAAVRFTVDSAILKESLEVNLPVAEPFVWEAATVIGQTETSAQEGLEVPGTFLGAAGEGLALALDSTLASSLIEAIRFLDLYPYDCLEQKTSKLFAYLLYDWLLDDRARIERELESLPAYQAAGGGMSFWSDPGRRIPDYYVSLRAAHLARLAAARGYRLPAALDRRALLDYLAAGWPGQTPYLKAYALYVLALSGAEASDRAEELRRGPPGELGVLEQAFLALAWQALGREDRAGEALAAIRNTYRVGTRSLTLTGPVSAGPYYGGELQAKALLLLLYGRTDPGSPIAQALADDLLASSRKGYWGNTSDTGWVLQAFAARLEAGKEREADFQARVRLAGAELAAAAFRGPSRAPFTRTVEPARLQEIARGAGAAGPLPLTFGKEGRGRLYYTASLRYARPAAEAEPRDEGIVLFTEVLDAAAEGRAEAAPGDTLKLGRIYRVRAVLSSDRDRDFLVLRVPVPAGAEVIDGSLAVSERLAPGESGAESERWGPIRRIYEDEARFIYDTFPRGKREASFLVRTTTPGEFTTPPAAAELMYEQEVFGRTAGRLYRIVP